MDKNTKSTLIVVGLVIVAIVIFVMIFKGDKEEINENNQVGEEQQQVPEEAISYPVDVQGNDNTKENNGVKTNTSSKLNETKDVKGLKISNIQLTYSNGISTVEADVKNETGKDIEEVGIITLKIKDSDNKVVREMSVYMMDIKNGDTKKLSASVTSDISNATDIEFSR